MPDDVVEVGSFLLSQVCEAAIGAIMQIPDGGWPNFQELLTLFAVVPPPRTHADGIVSARMLSGFLRRSAVEIHRRLHGGTVPESCSFDAARYPAPSDIDQTRPTTWSASSVFSAWARAYAAGLRMFHPDSIVDRTKQILETRLGQPVSVAHIARELGCSASVLEREFFRKANESIGRYSIRLRAREAFGLLRTTPWKVEAVARATGWKSKKDLYAAMQRLIRMTPGQIRALGEADASAARDRLGVGLTFESHEADNGSGT